MGILVRMPYLVRIRDEEHCFCVRRQLEGVRPVYHVLRALDRQTPAYVNDTSWDGALGKSARAESTRKQSERRGGRAAVSTHDISSSESAQQVTYRSDFFRLEPEDFSLLQYEPPTPPRLDVLSC